jgi:CRISPR-associated protein Csm4
MPTLLVRFRPRGPWRFGEGGTRESTDTIGHSDTLHAALGWAARKLDRGAEWESAISGLRVSSMFPFVGRTLYVAPPRTHWPPPTPSKLRLKSAKLIPLSVAQDLLAGRPLTDERWDVDARSACLIPAGGIAPFRIALRRNAAVDPVAPGAIEAHSTACLEFPANAGLWCALAAPEESLELVRAAMRLLGDAGIGGERNLGWGQSAVEFAAFPEAAAVSPSGRYWLLSLFVPGEHDAVDWSKGDYRARVRRNLRGRAVRMIEEGGVIAAASPLSGSQIDLGVGEPHWRNGVAFAFPLPAEPAA